MNTLIYSFLVFFSRKNKKTQSIGPGGAMTMQRMPNSAAVLTNQENIYDDTYYAQNLYEDAVPVCDQLYSSTFASSDEANASDDVYAVPDKKKKMKLDLPDDLPDETEIMDNELYGASSGVRQSSKPQTVDMRINLSEDVEIMDNELYASV